MSELIDLHIEHKVYQPKGPGLVVFQNFDLTITRCEFVAILGPSGCGKSTLLRIIAELDKEYTGNLHIAKADLSVSFLFQDLVLLPWLTVAGNLKFISDDAKLADQRLAEVGLLEYKNFMVKELSGGMKQRLAIARGLMNDPELVLLDEPLRELDMITKEHLQSELKNLLKDGKRTCIMVSHDVEECIYLADRIIVLSDKPAVIKKIFKVTSDMTDRSSMAFQELKYEIRREIF